MSRSFRRQRGLSPVQYEAIRLSLQEKKGQTEIAGTLGLSRVTVNRWFNQDWTFIAELNRQLKEMLADERRQRLVIRKRALDVLHAGIDTGDTKLALRVYEILQKSGGQIGSEYADGVGEAEAMGLLVKAGSKATRTPEIKDFVREHLDVGGALQARWERQLEGSRESLSAVAAKMPVKSTTDLVGLVSDVHMGLWEMYEAFSFSEGEGLRALASTTPLQQEQLLGEVRQALDEASGLCWDEEEDGLVWKGPVVMGQVVDALAHAAGLLLDSVADAEGQPSETVALGRSVEGHLASARASLDEQSGPIIGGSKTNLLRLEGRLRAVGEAGIQLGEAMELSMFIEDDRPPEQAKS